MLQQVLVASYLLLHWGLVWGNYPLVGFETYEVFLFQTCSCINIDTGYWNKNTSNQCFASFPAFPENFLTVCDEVVVFHTGSDITASFKTLSPDSSMDVQTFAFRIHTHIHTITRTHTTQQKFSPINIYVNFANIPLTHYRQAIYFMASYVLYSWFTQFHCPGCFSIDQGNSHERFCWLVCM